jgi:DNA excision repair protein ERCC-2
MIIDEAHNLADRVKDMATHKISTIIIKKSLKEASKYQNEEVTTIILDIEEALRELSNNLNRQNPEKKLKTLDFKAILDRKYDYEEIIASLEFFSEKVIEEEKKSSISTLASFLQAWTGPDNGFLRMIEWKDGMKEPFITLSYKCLDPSIITSNIINQAHSTILMSGTLTPTRMYAELLGVDNYLEREFKSPFSTENRLNLIIPKTTTKFQARSDDQYKDIAKECAKVTDLIPGNSIVFFPSYYLLEEVKKYFVELNEKTVFSESRNLDKNSKNELMDNFKKYKETGAVLLAVVSGSFGEGIDLPGDLLKGVMVVGLPLSAPDLETKSLIDYFDTKFGKGWEYGYTAPALNKVMQNAGRCIRSESDRGIIAYLDERYAWSNYKKYLPNDKSTVVTQLYEEKIKNFFNNQ